MSAESPAAQGRDEPRSAAALREEHRRRKPPGSESAATVERCRRCDLPMVLQPFYEGSEDECWYCPCCKSKLRTVPQLEATWERRRIALGMTVEEFETHLDAQTKAQVRDEPLSEVELLGLQRKVAEFAEEWEPACEHDKENPWRSEDE